MKNSFLSRQQDKNQTLGKSIKNIISKFQIIFRLTQIIQITDLVITLRHSVPLFIESITQAAVKAGKSRGRRSIHRSVFGQKDN